jgi:hypothetical protein
VERIQNEKQLQMQMGAKNVQKEHGVLPLVQQKNLNVKTVVLENMDKMTTVRRVNLPA